MKTIKLIGKDKIKIEILYSEKEGIKSWKDLFWKRINLRHKNERCMLVLGNVSWGFARINKTCLEDEIKFVGDGELHQI